MSEEKPSGGSQPQQSFGSAPGSGEQSFGSAPEPAPQPSAPQPPAPQPPATEPPADQPPAAESPSAQPPTAQPPAAEPDSQQAPAQQAPAEPAQAAGDQSFGGAPQPPAQGETFGEAPPPPPTGAPPKRRGWLRVVGGVIIAVVLLCVVAAFVLVRFINSDPLRDLSVGDCLADVPTVSEGENRQVTGARKVDCADPSATHRVEARYDDRTPGEAAGLCASHPTANFVITPDRSGDQRGYVLCLSTVGE